jgi:hypothetical protein
MFRFSTPNSRKIAFCVFASLGWLHFAGTARASVDTDEKFETVFTSAGYSTALGAGIGAALLAFTANPKEKFHYITTGASVGFLGGAALGGYLVLVVDSGHGRDRLDPRQKAVDLTPSGRNGLRLDWTLAQF